MSATPVSSYLRPNYPYKVKHNMSMAKTLDGAWKRFEDQLRWEEDLKRKQAEQFHNGIIREQQQMDSEVIRKAIVNEENRRELEN